MSHPFRRLAPLALTAALVTGCGSRDGGQAAAAKSGGGATTVAIGISPTVASAPLFTPGAQKLFTREGLTLKTTVMTSGAAAVPQLLNGQLQFAMSDPVAAVLAAGRKVPIRIAAGGNVAPDDPSLDYTALLARPGGAIKTAADLNGRTVAVNALHSVSELITRVSIAKAGGDPAKVKLVELPIPEMVQAVQKGRVDAGVVSEPFLAIGQKAGLRSLVNPASATLPGVPLTVFLTSESYAREHADVIARFRKALAATLAYAKAHPQEVRQASETSSKVPPALVNAFRLPYYTEPSQNLAAMPALIDLLAQYRFMPAKPALGDVVLGGS
jgi:NitT/TauT family transport system substrate-binding protein